MQTIESFKSYVSILLTVIGKQQALHYCLLFNDRLESMLKVKKALFNLLF